MSEPSPDPTDRTLATADDGEADVYDLMGEMWDKYAFSPSSVVMTSRMRAEFLVAADPPRYDLFGIRRELRVRRLMAECERELWLELLEDEDCQS